MDPYSQNNECILPRFLEHDLIAFI